MKIVVCNHEIPYCKDIIQKKEHAITCLLKQKCLTTNIVYQAKVTLNNRSFQEKVEPVSVRVKPPLRNYFSITKNQLIYVNTKIKQLSNEVWQIKYWVITEKLYEK